jgi:D-inositol-3-phosphate glycosyltransferase
VTRVLYSFPHTLGDPGIGTTALNQVRGIVEAGVEVHLYCTATRAALPPGVRIVQSLSIAGQRLPHRAVGVARAYRYHDRLVARALRAHPDRYDAVHAWPRGCLNTFAAAGDVGVVSFRESPSPHTASAFARAKESAAELGLLVPAGHSHEEDPNRLAEEAAEYEAADLILAPSDYVVRTYVEQGYPASRIVRHRYGYDPLEFPKPGPRAQDQPFTATFLGRGEPNKGLHHAARAWLDAGLAERGRLLIAGRVQPDYRDRIAPLLGAAHAEELGFVSDTAGLLRTSDVLLLPTSTEGSALVVFEAMASGAVPLVSDAAGAPVRSDEDGFVHAAGDVAALTRHLAALSGDSELLATMRAHCLARREELSWHTAGAILRDAYLEGIARAEPKRS